MSLRDYMDPPPPCSCGHPPYQFARMDAAQACSYPAVLAVACINEDCPDRGKDYPLPVWEAWRRLVLYSKPRTTWAPTRRGTPPPPAVLEDAAAVVVVELLSALWHGIKAARFHPLISWTMADLLCDYPRHHDDDMVDALGFALHCFHGKQEVGP